MFLLEKASLVLINVFPVELLQVGASLTGFFRKNKQVEVAYLWEQSSHY